MDIAGAAFALAALGCHAQFHLHIVKPHARTCAARNGVIRYSTADANYHVPILNENDSQKQVVFGRNGIYLYESAFARLIFILPLNFLAAVMAGVYYCVQPLFCSSVGVARQAALSGWLHVPRLLFLYVYSPVALLRSLRLYLRQPLSTA